MKKAGKEPSHSWSNKIWAVMESYDWYSLKGQKNKNIKSATTFLTTIVSPRFKPILNFVLFTESIILT